MTRSWEVGKAACDAYYGQAGYYEDSSVHSDEQRESWDRVGLAAAAAAYKFDGKPDPRRIEILTAACLAHRGCCGAEHDPANGKLHGYCVVCGVAWPCETAQQFLAIP